MNEEEYQHPKEQVKKVFEDDKVLIVSPLTWEANKYYGLNSPWYEEGWSGTREFERRLDSGGKIYYIVNKETGEKDSFYKDQYGILWYNSGSKMGDKDVKELIKFAPSAEEVISTIIGKNTLKKLLQFVKGKINSTELINSDPSIYDVRVNNKSLANSQIIFTFDDDEFYDLLDLTDDDRWFYNAVMARDYEFRSYDQLYDDNKEGYGVFNSFDEENMEKLKKISNIFIMPNEDFEPQNEHFMGDLYKKLYETFSRELDNIDYYYLQELNSKSSENARKRISEEIEEYLKRKNFNLLTKGSKMSTTVENLILLYSINGVKGIDLKTLLEMTLEPGPGTGIWGWSDDFYEFETRDLDYDFLNSKFSDELDNILEKLEEDTDMVEYFRLTERLAQYKLKTWYETPKDKNILFQIKKIDPNTLKIQVNLRKKDSRDWDKTHYFTEENFNNFLHQPELFSIFDEK